MIISRKQYVLADIMKKRKRDQTAVENKIKSKLALKSKRKKNNDALKAPEKFIKQYVNQQKAYSHYKLKVKLISILRIDKIGNSTSKEPIQKSMELENF